MAQRNQIRSFQDRGTLRFRVQDIQELARRRGMASDVDQPLGGPPMSPRSPRKTQFGFPFPERESGVGKKNAPEDFSLTDDQVDIGRESSSGSAQKSDSKKSPSRPKPGTDSDVRLISDQELSLNIGSDSDIKLVSPDSNVNVPSSSTRKQGPPASGSMPPSRPRTALSQPASSGPLTPGPLTPGPLTPDPLTSGKGGPASSGRLRSKLGPPSSGKSVMSPSPQRKSLLGPNPLTPSPVTPPDEEERLIRADSDSDVKIVGAGSDEMELGKTLMGPADSDIRLEGQVPSTPEVSDEGMLLTEEINLDEEIRKQDEAFKKQVPRLKGKSQFPPEGPGVSRTELGPTPQGEPSSPAAPGQGPKTELGRAPSAGVPAFQVSKTELGQAPKPRAKSKLDVPPQHGQVPRTELGKAPAQVVQPRTELGKAPAPGTPPKTELGQAPKPRAKSKLDVPPPLGQIPRTELGKAPAPGTPPKTELGQVPKGRPKSRLDAGPSPGQQPRTELGKAPPPGTPPKTELGQAPKGRAKSRLDAGPVPGQQPRTELGKAPPPGTPPKTELGQAPKGRAKSRLDAGPVPGQQPRTELGKVPAPGTPSKTELGQAPPARAKSKLDGPGHSGPGKTEFGPPKVRMSKLAGPGQTGKTEMRKAAGQPSPFELSDDQPIGKDPVFLGDARESTDFDVVPTGDGNVQVHSDDDFSLELPEENEQVGLGVESSSYELQGPTSGINLADPVDVGISLEPQHPQTPDDYVDSSSEFELSLDDSSGEVPAQTPALADSSDFEMANKPSSSEELPALQEMPSDSDSEFELSLESSEELPAVAEPAPAVSEGSENEFEFGLEPSSDEVPVLEGESPTEDSDSEFELTLDDSGNLASDQEDAGADRSKDIFETEDELPGLEEESSPLDTELESSEFDIEGEEESGSAVIALEEDDLEEPDEPAARPSKKKARSSKPVKKPAGKPKHPSQPRPAAFDEEMLDDADLEQFDELKPDLEYAQEEPVRVAPGPVRMARPAPWGVLPTLFMLPCLIIMIFLGIVSFEMAKNSNGYGPPNLLVKYVSDLLNMKIN